MKRAPLPGLAVLAFCAACDNSDHLQIVRFAEVGRGANQCVANLDAPPAMPHILDVGIAGTEGQRGYVAAPVVQNNFAEQAAAESEELDAVNITAVDVELIADAPLAGALGAADKQYRVPATGVLIRPGKSAAVVVEILPQKIARNFATVMSGSTVAPTVRALIRPVGNHDGEEIVGTPSELPIEVCKYCLTIEPNFCPSGGFAAASVLFGGCQPSQDQPVTCCMAEQLRCGSAVPTHQ